MRLDSPVTFVKGVGPALSERLQALGITTIRDLILYFPRRYDDFSHVTPIADVKPGNVTVKGTVEAVSGRHLRRRLHITEAVIDDGTAKMRAVWFNQPYRADQLHKGGEYYFSGVFDLQRNRYVLSSPAVEQVDRQGVSTARIVPVYRESAGIRSQQLRKILIEAVPLMRAMPESLPPQLVTKAGLITLGEALPQLHFPESAGQLAAAKARLAYEEILQLVMASLLNKRETAALKGWHIPFKAGDVRQLVARLPFQLTNAQRCAAWEIFTDFEKAQPMNRLLQGDVGSGKTMVAALAAFMAARAGLQTAFMAPTEILATQHATGLANILGPAGVQVGLLVGGTKAKAKTDLKQRIAAGELDVVVGTHALIQGDTVFHKLGLVVIDEQHRFGVRQRAELLTKSEHMPHLLSMTATPIPRSLQLTVYGELEVSILNELPKGRQPIITKVVSPYARAKVYEAIDEQISAGRQAYVVCPLVAEGATAELKSVEAEHDRLTKSVFRHRRLGLLHGQMKPEEKEAVMARFKNHELDILVATTVVEVGVDVPNATVMLIEGAERFGLAQLHQLRGRVGRGGNQSYCYLIPTTADAVSRRLRELEASNDGFYLAETDLALRGPGEIYGRAQHGQLNLNFASLNDMKLLKKVREDAEWLLQSAPNLLQYKQLYEGVERYRRLTRLN